MDNRSRSSKNPLANPELADIVQEKILEYDGRYYSLEALCIMSNHFHILVDTTIQLHNFRSGDIINEDNYTNLDKFMQLIKGGSAYKINQLLGRKGTFWQRESYDHLIRSDKEQYDTMCYIINNPVKAGIV